MSDSFSLHQRPHRNVVAGRTIGVKEEEEEEKEEEVAVKKMK